MRRQALRSEAEVDRLVRENRKLVEYMVNRYLKRYFVQGMERDDLVSWGLMGLVNAARAFDDTRGISFSTLACRAIERMIIRGVRREWKPERENRTVSLDALLNGAGGDPSDARFIDHLPSADDVEATLLAAEEGKALKDALDELPGEHSDLIRRHFLEGEQVRDIAADLGMTRQGVYSREKLILRRLRENLSEELAMAA